jgi:photosystem II stability/assembly factor-like uncharacterized protein
VAIVGGSGSRLSWGAIEFYEAGVGVAITTTSLSDTLIGQAYAASTLTATGGIPPYVFSIVGSSLPPGLNLAGGVISGTSTAAGTYPFTVMVTDSSSPAQSNYQSLSIFVAAPLAIQAASLPNAVTGQAYAQPITATGGLGTRIWSLVTGALPPGMTVAPDGTVTGIASVTGAFTFTVRVQTPSGFDEEQFNLMLVAPVPGNESIWTTTFPPGGSIVAGGLDIDPTSAGGDLYAAPAMRGLYKSTDAGTAWASILDHVQTLPFDRSGINNMAFGPTGVLYVMAHGSIYRSHDRGGTWTWSSAGLGQWVMSVLPATSSVLYAATSVAGVYRSTDGGMSWTSANSGLPLETIWALAAVPGSSSVIYAGTEYSGLYKTTDGGDTWAGVAVESGSPLTRVEAVAIDPLLPTRMYVTGSSAGQDGMWRSLDGGLTWVRLQVPVSNGYRNGKSLAVHPHVAGTVYFLSGNQVLKSVDGGDTWPSAVPFPGLFGGATSIRVHPMNDDWVFAGTDSGMYRSLNAGASWEQANAGMRAVSLPHSAAHSVHVDLSDANYVYAGTNGGGSRSVNGGQAWETMGLPESWARTIVTHPAAPGRVYALGGNLWRSDSNGASGTGRWVQPDNGVYCCSGEGDLALHPTDPNTLYRAMTGARGGQDTGVFKSTNGGETWAAAGMTGLSVHTLAVHPSDGNTLYAGVPTWSGPNGGIYKTTNGGATWVKLGGGLPAEINPNQIVVHPLDPSIVYVGSETSNGGVYKSLDGGATWTRVLSENVNSVAVDPANLGTVYAATWNSGGFYRSLDGGSTWAPVNEGLPRQHGLESIAFMPSDPTRLFLGTTGGVYVRRF